MLNVEDLWCQACGISLTNSSAAKSETTLRCRYIGCHTPQNSNNPNLFRHQTIGNVILIYSYIKITLRWVCLPSTCTAPIEHLSGKMVKSSEHCLETDCDFSISLISSYFAVNECKDCLNTVLC